MRIINFITALSCFLAYEYLSITLREVFDEDIAELQLVQQTVQVDTQYVRGGFECSDQHSGTIE